jgi:hypothetical protein
MWRLTQFGQVRQSICTVIGGVTHSIGGFVMGLLNKRAVATIGCLTLAMLFVAPTLTRGDEWNLATRFSINHPFEVPGTVLQPNTKYVMRLLDSPSNRNVVQVYNEDETKMLTMFMAISAERLEPTDKTQFSFMEMQPGYPLPIKEWFYPGRLHGLEFVYPKDQALTIAQHSRGEEPLTETATITKTEETIVEKQPSVAETTPAEPAIEQEQVAEQPKEEPVEIAQNTPPEVPQEPALAIEQAPAATESRELPRTAGELPLLALAGALCLGAGLGMKVLSSKL